MAKQCELCGLPARMFCESDQASLCWECDAKVHGANFLVARHSRSLLCRSCQAPTPWRASGARLGATTSVCNRCLGDCAGASDSSVVQEEVVRLVGVGRRDEWTEGEDSGDFGEEDESEEDEDEDEDQDDDDDGDNQVVPWSTESDTTMASPPRGQTSSSSEESSSDRAAICYGFLKRRRENGGLPPSHNDSGRSRPPPCYLLSSAAVSGDAVGQAEAGEEATYLGGSFRLPKGRRTAARPAPGPPGPSPPALPPLRRDPSGR